jgi:cytidine deaminase
MKERIIQLKIIEYSGIDELGEIERKLVDKAREASIRAYAPYSNFRVGAAVLLDNNEIITGNNQENAASPSGLCAERTAIFYAASKYPGIAIRSIAVSANSAGIVTEKPIIPCGACLQTFAEYEDSQKYPIKIILDGTSKIEIIEGIDNILPLRFKK